MDRLTGDFKGASMFATVEQARQYNRLRQYEGTGLTPDEIAALRAENERARRVIERSHAMLTPALDGSRAVDRARAVLADYLTGSVVTRPAPR